MPTGPRKPRDLDRYTSQEEAVRFLEQVAANVRAGKPGTLYKIQMRVSLWTDEGGAA